MKGISAIIATILLLLIVVAIVGFTFGFFQNLFTTSSGAANLQVNTTTAGVSQAIRIENVFKGTTVPAAAATMTIIDVGAQQIGSGSLQVYINGSAYASGAWNPTTVQPSQRSTYTFGAGYLCSIGTTLKVSSLTNSDDEVC